MRVMVVVATVESDAEMEVAGEEVEVRVRGTTGKEEGLETVLQAKVGVAVLQAVAVLEEVKVAVVAAVVSLLAAVARGAAAQAAFALPGRLPLGRCLRRVLQPSPHAVG